MLKQGKCLKFLKLTTKPKILEKLKRSWDKVMELVMEFEELNRGMKTGNTKG